MASQYVIEKYPDELFRNLILGIIIQTYYILVEVNFDCYDLSLNKCGQSNICTIRANILHAYTNSQLERKKLTFLVLEMLFMISISLNAIFYISSQQTINFLTKTRRFIV